MIINSMADAQVTNDKLVQFNFRDISYAIQSSSGQTITGQVKAQSYLNVNAGAIGSGPYKVTLGYVNHSYQAQPVVVDSADAMVTFWMAFPAGPNGPKTFVFQQQTANE
jgi:hypothetical protein